MPSSYSISPFLFLHSVVVGLILITIAVVLANHRNLLDLLPFFITLLVTAVPVALPAMLTITMALGSNQLSKRRMLAYTQTLYMHINKHTSESLICVFLLRSLSYYLTFLFSFQLFAQTYWFLVWEQRRTRLECMYCAAIKRSVISVTNVIKHN